MKNRVREEPLCIDVEESLKIKFQVFCVRHQISMKAVVGKLLKKFLEEQHEKEKE